MEVSCRIFPKTILIKGFLTGGSKRFALVIFCPAVNPANNCSFVNSRQCWIPWHNIPVHCVPDLFCSIPGSKIISQWRQVITIMTAGSGTSCIKNGMHLLAAADSRIACDQRWGWIMFAATGAYYQKTGSFFSCVKLNLIYKKSTLLNY